MKTEIETTAAAVQIHRQNPTPAPSLRVPVTSSNRAILRQLRAAEMFAWEAADRHPRQRMTAPALSHQSCLV
jgi:hypothetical protein